MTILSPLISLTWAAFQSLEPDQAWSHDWTGERLRQLGQVPLIELLLNLTTWWIALAGTTDPSGPKGWWPDPLATRTLELT